MSRKLNSIFECLKHLDLVQRGSVDRNIEEKIFSLSNFLWSPFGSSRYIIQPYRREDGLGFCLLEENEDLPEDGKAKLNFLVIKPGKSFDTFRLNFQSTNHINFQLREYSYFTKINTNDFLKIFFGSAQSRASNTQTFIY